jgi:5'-nucleotidase
MLFTFWREAGMGVNSIDITLLKELDLMRMELRHPRKCEMFTESCSLFILTAITLFTILFILAIPDALSISEDITLTILHTNDTYGRLMPFSIEDMKFDGVITRAHVIDQIKKETPNALIVLDSGDAIGPYPLAAFDYGKTVIELMNRMGYTAMALGNHEFNYGVEELLKRVSDAEFTMLSANTYVRDTKNLLTPGYLKTEVNGVKVGIIGLTTPTTRYRASPALQRFIGFSDPISAAKDAVKELKSEGCDLIIALSHLGYQGDMELIAQVGEIHLVLGSEVELPMEKTISAMSPIDDELGTTLVYCPWFGTYLGRVDVHLKESPNGGYIVKNMDVRKYKLDEETYPEEALSDSVSDIKSILDKLVADYKKAYNGSLGRVAENEEINSLELVPLIIREQTGAEIVLLNRGSLKEEIFKGDIQQFQITESVRYSNQIVLLELTGAQLKEALKHSEKQVSENRKLLFLGLDASDASVNGRPINLSEYYTVATNDFLASGGDGYTMLASARKRKDTGAMMREAVVDYILERQASGESLSLAPLKASLPKRVLKSKVGLDLMLKGLTVSQSAGDYPNIKLLQSKNIGDFFHWSIQSELSTLLASPKYDLELGLVSKYGRLQHPSLPSIELDDSAKATAIFRFLPERHKLKPIARLEIENIEFTPSEDRRTIAQLSAGVERKIFHLILSGGILLRRHRPEETHENQVNLDLRAQYQAIARGIQLKSELRFFPIFLNTASDSQPLEDYVANFLSSIKIPLSRYLFLSGSIVLYRETRIGSWAHNMDIAIQIHRSWGKKP